ncbi:SpoIIE family protein phosphatase [Streptomyces sp. NPDC059567]|uniref:SpoIIE family protein phosphatase n=1 Tax=Streptomyces sp. NPDC059567 TaxID=3346867 RepID=UPI003681FF0C
MPDDPLFTLDVHGRVVEWSKGAERLFRRPAADALGQGVFGLLGSEGSGRPWTIAPFTERSPERAWAVRAADEGPPGMSEAILDAVFTQADIGLHILDPQLRVLRINPVAIGMRGVPQESVIGLPAVEAYAPMGIHLDESLLQEVLVTGRPVRDVLLSSRPFADPEREHIVSMSVHRLSDQADRALGLVATTVDVTDRERAQARLRLLHEARERIGSSLDVERTAGELVDVAVPDFADSAVVALTDGVLQGKAPELLSRGGEILLRCTAAGSSHHDCPVPPAGSILLPGLFGAHFPTSPVILPPSVPKRPGPADTVATRRLVAPLSTRGQIFGMVAFERRPGGSPFTAGDVDLAKGITTRTAVHLENALRFTREHVVMTALESWPLRPERQTQRAAEIAQRHRSAGSGGGSWFDTMPLPGARVALVVGQVEHPGLSTVATMSRLRTAVHSLTTLDLDPHELLARLHSTVLRLAREQGDAERLHEPTVHCTFAVHDPVSGRFDIARAGRSLLAIVRPDGTVDTSPVAEGHLLGEEGPPFASAGHVLPEGSTICLASPALSEQEGPTVDRLAAALGHPGRGPQAMADDVEGLLAPDRVLLVARTRRLPARDVWECDVAAEFQAVGRARKQAEACMRAWGLAVDPFAAELVVSELVTNAVRYGAAPITLRLIRGESTLTCEVDDTALTAPHLRHARAVDEGGRGLHICATLSESWGVRYGDEGKTVWAELHEPSVETGAFSSPDEAGDFGA